MTATANSNLELLTLLVDSNDEDESEYRFLVDGKHVKYITVEPGALPKDDRTFTPVLLTLLPTFPPGDWNEGHIAKHPDTGLLFFAWTKQSSLPGVENIWHPTRIDHLDLEYLQRIRQNVHVVQHRLFNNPVLIKFTEFPWQTPYLEAETTAYEWINGKGIGPEFLGHLTEGGRVNGFVLEYLEGASSAGPEDLAACQRSLTKLHSLGIKHGDINKHNFLMREGEAILVDFESAERSQEREELALEIQRLEQSLSDPSTKGGVGKAVLSEHMPT